MAFNQRLKRDQYEHAYVLAIEHLFELKPEDPYDITDNRWVVDRISRLFPQKTRPTCFYMVYIRPMWVKLQKYILDVLDECIKQHTTILPNENEVWTLIGYVLAQTYAQFRCPCHNRERHLAKNQKNVCTLTIYSHTIGLNTLKLICSSHRNDTLKRCARCKCALYFSSEEQEADYPHHKLFCSRPPSWWHLNMRKRLLMYNRLHFREDNDMMLCCST